MYFCLTLKSNLTYFILLVNTIFDFRRQLDCTNPINLLDIDAKGFNLSGYITLNILNKFRFTRTIKIIQGFVRRSFHKSITYHIPKVRIGDFIYTFTVLLKDVCDFCRIDAIGDTDVSRGRHTFLILKGDSLPIIFLPSVCLRERWEDKQFFIDTYPVLSWGKFLNRYSLLRTIEVNLDTYVTSRDTITRGKKQTKQANHCKLKILHLKTLHIRKMKVPAYMAPRVKKKKKGTIRKRRWRGVQERKTPEQ
ncbi:hypothetical protein SmphiM6_103 [Sinorhizobium phage phiM6]|nr:hypothetical protein SmphiM6_103 [Sinorhizobium phage phiM6]